MSKRKLTAIAVEKANKAEKLSDGGGMYLLVAPNGSKLWRYNFRLNGKQDTFTMGSYPEVSLAEAREQHQAARKLVKQGTNPKHAKKQAKLESAMVSANTFELVAREWHGKQVGKWTPHYALDVMRRLENNLFPAIGSQPISSITARPLLGALHEVEKRGAADMAKRTLQYAGQVFRYAIVTGRAERDISGDLKGALASTSTSHHAYLDEQELPKFLREFASNKANLRPFTRLAMRLMFLTFVRTSELIKAPWSEFDLDNAEWRIPAERMKMREDHIVPLSAQALDVLRELKTLSGDNHYVFPSSHKATGHLSNGAILAALKRMGYKGKATGHGFRSSASTILHDRGFRSDVIERQLSHAERNKVKAAYNHAQYLPERRAMMQKWADILEMMEQGGDKVIVGHFGRAA